MYTLTGGVLHTMTHPEFEKILLSSLGYGVATGISFGIKYHSLQVALLASLICGLIYGGIMAWKTITV
jgi:hypothetical protein